MKELVIRFIYLIALKISMAEKKRYKKVVKSHWDITQSDFSFILFFLGLASLFNTSLAFYYKNHVSIGLNFLFLFVAVCFYFITWKREVYWEEV